MSIMDLLLKKWFLKFYIYVLPVILVQELHSSLNGFTTRAGSHFLQYTIKIHQKYVKSRQKCVNM